MAKANVSNTLVVPEETKVFPYHDDYNEDKNFHRILFRPGYGVQARELTQIQTILQNQIERFGNHVFVNGSPVIGGDIFLQETLGFSVNLSSSYANTDIDVSQFKDKFVVLSDGVIENDVIKFQVLEVGEATENTAPVLFGNYITVDRFKEGQTIKVQGSNVFASAASSNTQAYCKFAHIKDSIYYFNGYFIKTPKQSVAFGKFNDYFPNAKLGVEFDDSIITENSDTSLLDPALEAFNYQAPGAARYKIEINLAARDLDSPDDEKFFELARVEGGVLKKIIKYPVYSELEEVLARRTYEESGNYTVKPFLISLERNKYDPIANVTAVLSPGKAYIYGYEYETVSDSRLNVPKAKTKETVSNYDLNMNYGNYVITSNLSGDFGITTMDTFDIHCVPYNFIDYTSNTTYQTTKTGTGRVKTIEFYSGDVDVDSRKYEFYLFDTRYRSINSNLASVIGNTVTFFNGSTLLSANTNAYNNAILRITDGTGSGYSYNIYSYNASTRAVTIDGAFISTPATSSNAAIEFDFNDSYSFVKHINYTPGATANANTNITNLNKDTGQIDGDAFVSEPSLNTLVFKVPDRWMSNGISQQVYTYVRKYNSVQFNNGVTGSPIACGTNEQFIGATGSNTSSTVMNNFLVVCSNPQSSARTTGEVIKASTTVTTGTPEQASFNTSGGAGDTFVATVYAKVEFDPGVQAKVKSFVPANTRTFSSETPSTSFINSTGSNTTVYLNAGQVVIQNPTRRTGVPESLFISDVTSVVKIYDLNGAALPAGGASLVGYSDVTERFELDTGQRDNFYDHATIRLKANYAPVNGPLIVCCRYYNHTTLSGEGGYFSVDSYAADPNLEIFEEGTLLGDAYSIIPDYKTSSGEIVSLRDCIDFRPKRLNASNATPNFTLSDIKIPCPTTDFEMTYQYFLGRRDLIILNSDKNLLRVEGIPAKFPQDPSAPVKSMVLYSLNVEPYTKFPSNVVPKYIENKRYTMRDIGKIEKRVENLEYYVTLNTLEKDALDITIRDVDGLDRVKYGILADSFKGHRLGASERADYQCAMNFNEGWLQNKSNTTSIPLLANTVASSNVTFTGDKAILNYTERHMLSQNLASKFAPLAELLYASFLGTIYTQPEADIWKSVNTAPEIVLTDTQNTEYTIINVYESIVDSQTR